MPTFQNCHSASSDASAAVSTAEDVFFVSMGETYDRTDSDYDDEVLQAANQAFFLWEEDDVQNAEPFLKKAAMAGHSHSMWKYGLLLLNREPSCRLAWDLVRSAALRGCEEASVMLQTSDEQNCVEDCKDDATLEKWATLPAWHRDHPYDLC
jgi:TPR repeat protein